MLYFDFCATTPPYPEVAETVSELMLQQFGNPSSLHRWGLEAERLLKRSRETAAAALRCHPDEIIFTSGGTESNNLAVKGTAQAYAQRGKHIITSAIEHASVYESCRQLEAAGWRVTYLPVDETGQVRPEDVRGALQDDTVLVSLMHVNNEMGRIQSIDEVGRLLKDYPRILFHVDAIQSFGKLPLDPANQGIDLLSVSAHKIRGPKGVGFLYCRRGIRLTPQLVGGGQERGVRSGTENVPLIVGMAKAVRLAAERQASDAARLYELRERLTERLRVVPGVQLSGSDKQEDMAPHLVHFSVPGIRSEVVVHALERDEIYISTRSACASGEPEPSRVLLAMGYDPNRAASGLRVSYSAEHTEQDMDFFADRLGAVLEEIRVTGG